MTKTKHPRKLALSVTTLRRLDHADLQAIAGGLSAKACATQPPPTAVSCPNPVDATSSSCI